MGYKYYFKNGEGYIPTKKREINKLLMTEFNSLLKKAHNPDTDLGQRLKIQSNYYNLRYPERFDYYYKLYRTYLDIEKYKKENAITEFNCGLCVHLLGYQNVILGKIHFSENTNNYYLNQRFYIPSNHDYQQSMHYISEIYFNNLLFTDFLFDYDSKTQKYNFDNTEEKKDKIIKFLESLEYYETYSFFKWFFYDLRNYLFKYAENREPFIEDHNPLNINIADNFQKLIGRSIKNKSLIEASSLIHNYIEILLVNKIKNYILYNQRKESTNNYICDISKEDLEKQNKEIDTKIDLIWGRDANRTYYLMDYANWAYLLEAIEIDTFEKIKNFNKDRNEIIHKLLYSEKKKQYSDLIDTVKKGQELLLELSPNKYNSKEINVKIKKLEKMKKK